MPVPERKAKAEKGADALMEAEAIVAAMEVLNEPIAQGPAEEITKGRAVPDLGGGFKPPDLPPVPPPAPERVPPRHSPDRSPPGEPAFVPAIIALAMATIVVILRSPAPPQVKAAAAAAGILIPLIAPDPGDIEAVVTDMISERKEAKRGEAGFFPGEPVEPAVTSRRGESGFFPGEPQSESNQGKDGPPAGGGFLQNVSQRFVPQEGSGTPTGGDVGRQPVTSQP